MNVEVFHVSCSSVKNQCYLLHNKGAGILIDPAWNYTLINDFLVNNAIELKAVLLTHSHPDHTDLAASFAEQYDVPVFMSDKEIKDYGFRCTNLTTVRHLKTLTIGDFNIVPVVTPGHTSGSTCFLAGEHFFCGDTILIEGVGICEDAEQMFDSVQFLKDFLSTDTIFWPGHSFGEPPGKNMTFLLKNNIYLQLDNKKHFVDLRMRRNQPHPFSFK